MIHVRGLYAAAFVAALMAWRPAHANLVTNPGFETGNFAGWTVSGGFPNIGVDTNAADVHSGTYGAFAGNDVQTALDQEIATVAGATYAVSFWLDVYQADATFGYAQASFGGQTVANLIEPTETDSFTQYTASLVATGPMSDLHFAFRDAPGFFGLDDVSVTQTSGEPPPPAVPEPASLVLLAAGLAGLAWSRRGAWAG